ncbi:hypothetical protein JST99_01600 [Candidatus Dependentiae bacterium]|nr:hypothetical protein [Candidatus Dependentiae bacterium]MCC7414925.1 hypothetical protein [Campylobacterota bacterium]
MYKHIALIALLLPFSGYAITKQERKNDILQELKKIEDRAMWYRDFVKNNYWAAVFSKKSIVTNLDELYQRAIALEAELNQIELEIMQEEACSKK